MTSLPDVSEKAMTPILSHRFFVQGDEEMEVVRLPVRLLSATP